MKAHFSKRGVDDLTELSGHMNTIDLNNVLTMVIFYTIKENTTQE